MRAWATAGAAVVLAGCGSKPADLFEVVRSGRDRNANLRLVVSDAGAVRCNGGSSRPLDARRLLAARELARALEDQAALGLELEPARNSTLRYEVRLEQGSLAFSDTSRARTREMNRLVGFTADVAENVCRLER